jgi:hypothetical protein
MRGGLLAENRKQLKQARKFVKTANLAMHVGSLAFAVEALEAILIERGLLNPDELMDRMKKVRDAHWEKGEAIPASED